VDKAARSKTGVWKMQEWSEVNKAVYKITRIAETQCPQGARAIRGSLRLIRHTSQQSSDALVAGSEVTGDAHRPLSLSTKPTTVR